MAYTEDLLVHYRRLESLLVQDRREIAQCFDYEMKDLYQRLLDQELMAVHQIIKLLSL